MSIVEPDFSYLNTLFLLIDKDDYPTCLKKTQVLKKKYPRSIFLNACEACCRARLSPRTNREDALSIFKKCLPYLKKQKTKIHPEIMNLFNDVLQIYMKYEEQFELHELGMSKYKKNENPDEKTLNHYFFACVQARKFKNQQRVCQQLDKLYKKKRYSIWWGFSMILQVEDFNPGDDIPFFFKMGERVFERNLYRVKNADPELIGFYVEFCNKMGKYDESIRILREKVSSLYDSLPIDRKSVLAKTYLSNGNFNEAKLMFTYLLDTIDSEQWDWWIGLFDAHDKIVAGNLPNEEVKIEMNINNSKEHQLEKEDKEDDKFKGNSRLEVKDDAYIIESPLSTLNPLQLIEKMSQKNPKFRTPYLALLEYLFRQQQNEEGIEATTTRLMVQCVEYYDRFSHLSSCFVDIKKYVNSLTDASKSLFISRLEELRKTKVAEGEKLLLPLESKMKESVQKERNQAKKKKKKKKPQQNKNKKPQPKDFNREEQLYVKQIQGNIYIDLNFYKFQKLVFENISWQKEGEEESEGEQQEQQQQKKKIEVIKKISQELYRKYETSIKKFSKHIQKATTNQFGDDYVLILVQYLFDLYHMTSESCHLYEAVQILEQGLRKSRFHYEFRVFLLRLYSILGDYKKSSKIFIQDINIKHAQYQSLSYLHVYELVLNHPKKAFLKYVNGNQQMRRWYHEIRKNVPGILLKAYRNRSWSRVLEAENFRKDVDTSLLNHQVVVWKVFMETPISYFTSKTKTIDNLPSLFDDGYTMYMLDYLKILPKYALKEDTGIFEFYGDPAQVEKSALPFVLPHQLGMEGEARSQVLNALKCTLFLMLPTNISDDLYDLPPVPLKKKKKKKKKKETEEEETEGEEPEDHLSDQEKRKIEVIKLFREIVSSPTLKKYEKYQKPLQVLADTVMLEKGSAIPSSVEIRKKIDQYLAYLVRVMKTVEPDFIKINHHFIQPMMFFLRFVLKPILILTRTQHKETKKQKQEFYSYVARRLKSMNRIYDQKAINKKGIRLFECKNQVEKNQKLVVMKNKIQDAFVREEGKKIMDDLFEVLKTEVIELAFDVNSTKM